MMAATTLLTRAALLVLALALPPALMGCGGGEQPDEAATASTQPVDCKATPKVCI